MNKRDREQLKASIAKDLVQGQGEHSPKGERLSAVAKAVDNHSRAAAPREKPGGADPHLALVRAAYEKATGNRWNKSDSEVYEGSGLRTVPAEKIISIFEAVARRTPARINSLAYFVKEIVALPEPRNRAWQKKQLEKIIRRIRDNEVGLADHSVGDLAEAVKCACAREAIPFDNDIFSELTG